MPETSVYKNIESMNGIREVQRQVREWAAAHAGNNRSKAMNSLQGSAEVRSWQDEQTAIMACRIPLESMPDAVIYSVQHQSPENECHYHAQVVVAQSPKEDDKTGVLIGTVYADEELSPPWGNGAGINALENIGENVVKRQANARNQNRNGDEPSVVFDNQRHAVVIMPGHQDDENLINAEAGEQSDWVNVVNINAAQQLELAKRLPASDLFHWLHAKAALIHQSGKDEITLLATANTQQEIDQELENISQDIERTTMFNLAHSLANILAATVRCQGRFYELMADDLDGTAAAVSIDKAMQQRVYRLEDQLKESTQETEQLRNRLQAYEGQHEIVDEEPAPEAAPEPAGSRHDEVLEAITDADQMPNLRFLTNSDQISSYGKARPAANEIINALTAINTLATAWRENSETGQWSSYFDHLNGWRYRSDESQTTMAKYGQKRSFSDQEMNRHLTVTRHLTYTGSRAGFQIFFEADPDTDKFIIGYMGEHLPYASENS